MTCSYSKEFTASAYTDVENVFIYEYLPVSSGEAVKVYLYGLFLCQNQQFDQSLQDIAKNLKLAEDTVIDCFKYWEEFGLVTIISKEPFAVQYLPVKSAFSGKPRKYKAEKYADFTKGVQAILPNRMISTNEYSEYFYIMENYNIKPEAMLMIVKYCVDLKGDDIGYRYISKVAKDFGARGINTVEKVENELSAYVLRTGEIEKVLKALSLKRRPELEDLTFFNKWTTEWGFESANVVFAASKMKKGGMEKLDAFLKELYSAKSFSKEEIADFINKKQSIFDLTVKINKALAVYVEVLDAEIDTFISKWLSYGYMEQTLVTLAAYCFKKGKNTLQALDELIDYLHSRGFVSPSSIGDYFEELDNNDAFITKILTAAGVNRNPTNWDRDNLALWKTWNFSQDMILEAARLSAGKSSPIAYINGILSNWKNKGVFTKEQTGEKVDFSQEDYNREYQLRREKANSKVQKNLSKALEIDGFAEVFNRLNSIEKDLAFAEFGGEKSALEKYENEQKQLLKTQEQLLKTINLTADDLKLKYICDKCKDTGYIGTKRCDCFDKIKK